MGNHYMNLSQRACGSSRYVSRTNRYPGYCANTAQIANDCSECANVTPVCPRETVCSCQSPTALVADCSGQTVTMAYVPMQAWGDLYEVDRAYCRGTLFRDLDKPFTGGRGV